MPFFIYGSGNWCADRLWLLLIKKWRNTKKRLKEIDNTEHKEAPRFRGRLCNFLFFFSIIRCRFMERRALASLFYWRRRASLVEPSIRPHIVESWPTSLPSFDRFLFCFFYVVGLSNWLPPPHQWRRVCVSHNKVNTSSHLNLFRKNPWKNQWPMRIDLVLVRATAGQVRLGSVRLG